jgi:hypothetical protein
MRKIIILAGLALLFSAARINAQSSYQTALGLGIDFGDGATLVGPSVKHFFAPNHAGQAEILFGDRTTFITALYEYNKDFPNAKGLKWYLGIGPSIGLYKGGSSFYIRPVAGLDYKINDVPLDFAFDWRPALYLGDNGSDFNAARFGLGFRYAF